MAWNVPNFSLQGQPGISPNWSAGIMQTIDDNRAQKKASDILLARKQAQAQAIGPDGKFNSQNAAQYLLGAGDLEGGRVYGQMAESEADREWRRQEAARAQQNADRSYGLQAQQLNMTDEERKLDNEWRQKEAERQNWNVTSIRDANGVETLVRVNKFTGEHQPIGSAESKSANPYYTGKFSGEQGKVAGFADRLNESEAVLSLPQSEAAATGLWNNSVSTSKVLPNVAKNKLVSTDFRKFDQAKRNFINATLRRESGAVISPEEFANADAQYFPQPWDDQETLALKAANRKTVRESFMRESGPNYIPKEPAAPQGADQPKAQETKSLGGKTYVKIDGQWFEQ
jgi:hypothetical protein